jgi:hypothetical protein
MPVIASSISGIYRRSFGRTAVGGLPSPARGNRPTAPHHVGDGGVRDHAAVVVLVQVALVAIMVAPSATRPGSAPTAWAGSIGNVACAMTLSILAREPETGMLGCAVTSCAVAAGRRILHARAGVGVAVAQASSMLVWGEELLDAAQAGTEPAVAVADLARPDNQLALLAVTGRIGIHTGPECEAHAGHSVRDGVCAQANLAALPDAWELMVEAYLSAPGPLAERLVSALAASGGDSRGQQGAAVIVTGATTDDELAGFWYEPTSICGSMTAATRSVNSLVS